ncbi:CDP-alcohol phosphatidyltransferase family protein [Rothia sp. AR01]|uniref:CDP-alcohol phosphatidyltransferase family protein n=1 Tax=Rothia santali TaxID=2949643 RepID=A0A9X2HDU3_9MICC|nr:CDP-alcohol phosphatidyltransferase family protein [Rothia santali]MCP3425012.1 CDP-alcohol phosphatidyltransferase family protein [Rothia santali]
MQQTGRSTRRRAVADALAAPALYLLAILAIGWFVAPPLRVGLPALGAGLAIVGLAVLSVLRRRPPFTTAADRITLFRVTLAGLCAASTVLMLAGQLPARGWLISVIVSVTLILDAVDGWVARRTGSSTPEGARLDMESDAALLLILSTAAALTLGPWVLAIGLMRYAYVLAARFRRPLRAELPFSQFRRVVAATQGVVLLAVFAPFMPLPLVGASAAAALTLLIASFARDVVLLERRAATERRAAVGPRPAPGPGPRLRRPRLP